MVINTSNLINPFMVEFMGFLVFITFQGMLSSLCSLHFLYESRIWMALIATIVTTIDSNIA